MCFPSNKYSSTLAIHTTSIPYEDQYHKERPPSPAKRLYSNIKIPETKIIKEFKDIHADCKTIISLNPIGTTSSYSTNAFLLTPYNI